MDVSFIERGRRMSSNRSEKFNNALLIFIFLDLFLFPYFPLFVIPISLPIVFLKLGFYKFRMLKNKETILIMILSFIVISSAFISFFRYSTNYAGINNIGVENLKRAFQFLTSFLYYFLIRNHFRDIKIDLKKIIMAFVLVYIVLGVLSYIDLSIYFRVLDVLKVRNGYIDDWYLRQSYYLFRYSYLWVDANTAAYGFQIIVFYALMNEKLKAFEFIMLYGSAIVTSILTMSTGSILSLSIFTALIIFNRILRFYKITFNFKKLIYSILSIAVILVLLVVASNYLNEKFNYVIEFSLRRMFENTDGGRLQKYTYLFQNKIPNILFGEGYILIREGELFRPHSDHLRILYSYGVLAYFISIWFLFRRILYSKAYFFILPGIMAFTINTLIDNQKILVIFLVLLAYTDNLRSRDRSLTSYRVKNEI